MWRGPDLLVVSLTQVDVVQRQENADDEVSEDVEEEIVDDEDVSLPELVWVQLQDEAEDVLHDDEEGPVVGLGRGLGEGLQVAPVLAAEAAEGGAGGAEPVDEEPVLEAPESGEGEVDGREHEPAEPLPGHRHVSNVRQGLDSSNSHSEADTTAWSR